MKTIFKKGDKVFDIRYGWGEVTHLDREDVRVEFSRDYNWYNELDFKLLSFTEYTLEGFSQERPCEFKDGDPVWVREFDCDNWLPRVFKEYRDGIFYTYDIRGHLVKWIQCKPFKTEEDEGI